MNARFLTPLDVRKLGKRRWMLLAPLEYESPLWRAVLMVPAGFSTDFASVPRLPLMFLIAGDRAHRPAVLHDFLYGIHLPGMGKAMADLIFKEAMDAEYEDAPWRRWLMYRAVQVAAHAAWAAGPTTYRVLNPGGR